MASRRNFLPAHPKIVKKMQSRASEPISRSYYKTNNDFLNSSSLTVEQQSRIAEAIIKKQEHKNQALQSQRDKRKLEFEALDQSLRLQNNEEEMEKLWMKINEAKQEVAQLEQKIKNCEKVEQTTTSQEYYLWQKKKKSTEYNKKIEQIEEAHRDERERLEISCLQYRQAIHNTKSEIAELIDGIQKLNSGRTASNLQSETESIDPAELLKIREEFKNLTATVGILKENNHIISSQLDDGVESIEKSLKQSFDNYKSTLIRDLQSLKRQVEESEPEPPSAAEQAVKSADFIEDYKKKMQQLRDSLSKQQAKDSLGITFPFDWTSVKWEQQLGEQNLSEAGSASNSYIKLNKQIEESSASLKNVEEQLKRVIEQTINCTQKNHEIEAAINKILRLSMSIR